MYGYRILPCAALSLKICLRMNPPEMYISPAHTVEQCREEGPSFATLGARRFAACGENRNNKKRHQQC